MKLFSKKNESIIDKTDLSNKIQGDKFNKENQAFFFLVIRILIDWLMEFSVKNEDLLADDFRKKLKKLLEKILSDASPKKKLSFFIKEKKNIFSLIEKQQKYLHTREGEFKNIIELLTQAMTAVNSKSQNFNQEILQKSEKIEKITLLDDIIAIKNLIQKEVDDIKTSVSKKEKYDKKQIQALSAQVNFLKTELEKTKEEALTDGLTGIYNRNAFDNYLAKLVEKNTIINSIFSIVLIDIDNFKQINDLYGHQTGDRVLTAIAKQCDSLTRNEDFTARYGGEEFVIIFKKMSLKNAIKKADKICKNINETYYSVKKNQKDDALKITVSIGAAVFKEGDTPATIIKRADMALYAAKSLGKNRVVSEQYLK